MFIEMSVFIAMNRFKIVAGCEDQFVDRWKKRESYLDTVPGFQEFSLLKGASNEEYTLFVSHSTWDSKEAFEGWVKSAAFRKAHVNAGENKDLHFASPHFEGFDTVL